MRFTSLLLPKNETIPDPVSDFDFFDKIPISFLLACFSLNANPYPEKLFSEVIYLFLREYIS
ncbi:MAG: hypothetical protein A2Y81_08830 [Nitrospirae bacterium RBG_13_43_8]|nr:MAG: hypothetical protein A2Y81_08830 [Nitrospirae bacterium RBG_13_43_8]